jgi:hypothetical protein
MLITSLGTLKSELGRYLFHSRFTPDYDTAIQNFESLANRRLRTRKQEFRTLLTTDIGDTVPGDAEYPNYADVPDDYLLWRSVLWRGRTPYVEIDYVHPTYLQSTWIEQDSGDPKIFTIEDGKFRARPQDESPFAYELHYYQKIASLLNQPGAGDNATNWLLTDHPDLYLEGALFELFLLERNGEAATAHKALRDEKLAELIQLSALTTGATSSLVRGEGAALGSGGEYF